MMRKSCIIFVLILCVLCRICSCGWVGQAGTWEDSPRNWRRAFYTAKPKDVVVVHSFYWRSIHFTDEYQYFFEIEPNDQFLQQTLDNYDLILVDGQQAEQAKAYFFADMQPDWFVPKDVAHYIVYVRPVDFGGDF
ncbi:MAG: hypothetical protein OEZ02_09850 [Anaerolineae bacterium]|nr:hypothetical protein [Anaerolineae bacterium]